MLLINEIKLTLNEPETKIRDKIAKNLRTSQFTYELSRRSVACRKELFFAYSVLVSVFVEHGARKDIKYKAHAHIGTDEVRKVITNITDDLIQKGAEFHFEEEVTDFIIEDNICKAIITRKDTYYSVAIIVGAGHSAYNTVKKLYEKGVAMEAKDMAIGFRVEHPQSLIDNNQYHGVKHEKLEPSEYF